MLPLNRICVILSGAKKEDENVLAKPGTISSHTKFKAQIYIFNEEEDEYNIIIFSNYKTLFNIWTIDINGTIELLGGTKVALPQDNIEIIAELDTPVALEKGIKFSITLGGKTIGNGVVLEIIE